MNNGVVIAVFNNREIDYARISLISGFLAKTNLKVPVSMITDQSTVDWMAESKIYDMAKGIFDKLIITERPITGNQRFIRNGTLDKKTVPFINENRSSVWDLTPYDKTLLIDSDYLIFSDVLSQYWESEDSYLIAKGIRDIRGDRLGYHDLYISDTGPELRWATTVMFTKNSESQKFFRTIDFVRENYSYFADLYGFVAANYRNDISFSIADHMLSGFRPSKDNFLPNVLTAQDIDIVDSIDIDGVRILINDPISGSDGVLSVVKNLDVHLMNKNSIVENFKSFEKYL